MRWRRVGLGLIGLYSAYLIIVNVLLVTHLLPRVINAAQGNVTLEYQIALSPLPAYVWVRKLRLVSRDSAIELELTADSARTWISPLGLLRHTFGAHGGGASGVAFHVRQRRSVPELCATDGASLPTIHGLAAPVGAWSEPRACRAQAETAMADSAPTPPEELWHVELHGVAGTDVRELWIEQFRYQGSAVADVSFALWPTQSLRIMPSTLEVQTASIGRGRADAPDIVGVGSVALDLAEVSLTSTGTLARALSATVAIDAQVMRLGLVDDARGGWSWIGFGRSHGHLTVDARIARGQLRPGTTADLRDATVVVEGFRHTATGHGSAALSVDARGPDRVELTAHVNVARAEVRSDDDDAHAPVATGRRLRIDVRADDPWIGAPLADPDLYLAIGAIEIPQVARLARYVPPDLGLHLESGTATASAHLEVRHGRLVHDGELRAETSDLRATYRDLALRARAALHVPLAAGDLDEPRLVLDGARIQVRDGHVIKHDERHDERAWTADVTLTRATITGAHAHEAGPIIDAQLSGHFASIRPFLAVYGADGRLPGFVRSYDPGPADGYARLHVSPDRMSTTEARIDAGAFSARADMYIDGAGADGGLLLGLGPLRLGVELIDGESTVHVLAPRERFERGRRERRRIEAP